VAIRIAIPVRHPGGVQSSKERVIGEMPLFYQPTLVHALRRKNWTGDLRAPLVYNFTTLQQHNNNVFKNLNLTEITLLSLK
jgi:hypothetical protein